LLKTVKPSAIISDIRIRNKETPMLKQAFELKLRILNGIPMVVNQGIRAFWWLYHEPLTKKGIDLSDVEDVMWRSLDLKQTN
jgi:shikimate 5-dehydrogenase